jgi:hypothetical protein
LHTSAPHERLLVRGLKNHFKLILVKEMSYVYQTLIRFAYIANQPNSQRVRNAGAVESVGSFCGHLVRHYEFHERSSY